MENPSVLISVINFLKKCFSFILAKAGYKIAKLDEYKEITSEVDRDYTTKSPQCIAETKGNAKFRWASKYHLGYERYSEINGDTRQYFRSGSQSLWIKRSNTGEP